MSVKNIQTKYYFYNKFGNYLYKIPVYNSITYFREKDVIFCLRKGNRILYIPTVHTLVFVTRYLWRGNLDTGDFITYQSAMFPDGSVTSSSKTLRYRYKNNIYYFLANKQFFSQLPSFSNVYFHIESAWQGSSDTNGFIIFSSYMNPSYPPNALKFKFHVKAISANEYIGDYQTPFRYEPVEEFDLWNNQEKAVKVAYHDDHSRGLLPDWGGKCRFQITCDISDDVVETDVYDFSKRRYQTNSNNQNTSIFEQVIFNILES